MRNEGRGRKVTKFETTFYAQPPRDGLCFPYPIRRGFIGQVVVPRDMTEEEAKRLCAFVMALAAPEEPCP